MNKRLTTDMAEANRLQRAIRPTGVFNIKKMATEFCSAQCIMHNTGFLKRFDCTSLHIKPNDFLISFVFLGEGEGHEGSLSTGITTLSCIRKVQLQRCDFVDTLPWRR